MQSSSIRAIIYSCSAVGVLMIVSGVLLRYALIDTWGVGPREITRGDSSLISSSVDDGSASYLPYRVSAVVSVSLVYPRIVSPSDAIPLFATVLVKSVNVDSDERAREFSEEKRNRLQQRATEELNKLLENGSLGLTLRLAGAEVQPKDVAPIVSSRASWSIKAGGTGTLQGFVSPLVVLPDAKLAATSDRSWRSVQIEHIVTQGNQPVELKVRTPLTESALSGMVTLFGTLLTIPGIFAFVGDRRKQREERRKREEEAKSLAVEERLKAEKDKRIILP